MTRFRAGEASHVGMVRSVNQDSTLVGDDVFAVADGMGGHQGGEIASELAIETLNNSFSEPTTDALVSSVQSANEKILARAQAEPELANMGTTMVVLAAVNTENEDRLAIANVGDSRCYLLEGDELRQLTKDHSMVQTLVDNGQITAAEAEKHPQKNILTRALGIDAKVLTDSWELLPFAGDRYLLCSDGLFNEVAESVIAQVLKDTDNPTEAADKLVELANEGGGRDNISVVIVDILDDGGRAAEAEALADRVTAEIPGGQRAIDDATLELTPEEAEAAKAEAEAEDGDGDGGGDGDTSARNAVTTADTADAADDADKPPEAEASRRRPAYLDTEPVEAPNAKFRGLLFGGVVVAILLTAIGAIAFAARSSYHVGFDLSEAGAQEVVIFQGSEGGILWFDATVHTRTSIVRDDVPAAFLSDILTGEEFASLEEAEDFIDELRAAIAVAEDTRPSGLDAGPEVIDPGTNLEGSDGTEETDDADDADGEDGAAEGTSTSDGEVPEPDGVPEGPGGEPLEGDGDTGEEPEPEPEGSDGPGGVGTLPRPGDDAG